MIHLCCKTIKFTYKGYPMSKLKFLATASLLFMITAANAQDGTITFTGEIVSNTCKITTGGGDVTVTLPRISQNNFTADARAGQTAFTIDLEDCTPASGSVGVRFVGTSTQIDTASGFFKNTDEGTADGAANVSVGVYDSTDTLIKTAGNSSAVVAIDTTGGTASIPLTAWYTKSDPNGSAVVTAGSLQAAGGIELVYQ